MFMNRITFLKQPPSSRTEAARDLKPRIFVGKFLSITYQGYLEPNLLAQGLKIVATNDTSALCCYLYPKIFTTKKANLTIDKHENPGRTYVKFCKNVWQLVASDYLV